MANVSRGLKHKRKLRRQANLMLRAARASRKDSLKYFSLFMTVLAQRGGEMVVTKGTIDQVEEKLGRLSFEIVKSENGMEFTLRLVEAPEPNPAKTVPEVTITKIADDDPSGADLATGAV
jgi:glucokinase